MAAVRGGEEGGSHSNLFGILEGQKMTWSDALWMNHTCDIWSIEVLTRDLVATNTPTLANKKQPQARSSKDLEAFKSYLLS